jgi:hypothetical protein
MQQRAGYRHRRRSANCRYRKPRSNNRTRPTGWLPPSLRHRVDTAYSQAARLCRYAPVTEIHIERVAFDTHAMSEGRALTTCEYQQGTLAGTEARAYLRAKWNNAGAYCDATGVPLNIDHLRPRSRGGSNSRRPARPARKDRPTAQNATHGRRRHERDPMAAHGETRRPRQTCSRLVRRSYEVEPQRHGTGEDAHLGRAVRRASGP